MVTAQPGARPRRRNLLANSRIQLSRRLIQATVFVFIIVASLRHNLVDESAGAASLDALCPFGGLETLWRYITSGQYVPKTHPSNVILGGALLLSVLFAGAAFCGWICPFGTLQDALTWLRTKLRIPELTIPRRLDRWMRYGRYITLAAILYMTISSVKLWFADYDPYRTIFGLGWIFEPSAEHWPAYAVAVGILVLSFFVPRFWCKYT
ncbi:MAG: 4Fe-4S binding protein [Caldilineaceae bacterium]